MRGAGIFWATLSVIPALCVLIGLGTWQLQRMAWKGRLQASIDERMTASPIPIEQALAAAAGGRNITYTRVRFRGRFHDDKALFYYAPASRGQGLGWHVYVPVQLASGGWLFVNRGFIPDAYRKLPKRQIWMTTRDITVTGLIRTPTIPGLFTPPNDPDKNIWYWRDLDGMSKAALPGLKGKLIPYFVDVDVSPRSTPMVAASKWPRPGTTITRLPNRHWEYALTWYGLALTLIGVYLAFVWGRLRHQSKST